MPEIKARHESWPLAEPFTISRGTKTTAEVVLASISHDGAAGRGECVPYARYGESVESVLAQIHETAPLLSRDLSRDALQTMLPPGAARNALDCALWDLEAKASGRRVWDLAGVESPHRLTCAYTLSLAEAESMHAAARASAHLPLLKMKVGLEGALERVRAVREGAPDASLIVDANESWTPEALAELLPELAAAGVSLLEQPLPAGEDAVLARIERPLPVAADESCHTAADVEGLENRYDVLNVKLDKSGGLTEALQLARRAERTGLALMVGCMVGTSLAMAPAMLIGAAARFVDLDGPLLLARDRAPGLVYHRGEVAMPGPALWG